MTTTNLTLFDTKSITERVIEANNGAANARLREILAALVRHLHDFTREVQLTPAERLCVMDFLTRSGQMTGPLRNEFSALSDALGLTALVDLLDHERYGATVASPLGPFFVENAPPLEYGADLWNGFAGERVVLSGRIVDEQGRPIAGAEIDFWQTDADGLYDVQLDGPYTPRLRGRMFARDDGSYKIRTVLPKGYTAPMDGPLGDLLRATQRNIWRPAHWHFRISANGYRPLITELYPANAEHLDDDVGFGVRPALIVTVEPLTEEDARKEQMPFPSLIVHYDFALVRSRAGSAATV